MRLSPDLKRGINNNESTLCYMTLAEVSDPKQKVIWERFSAYPRQIILAVIAKEEVGRKRSIKLIAHDVRPWKPLVFAQG